MKYEIKYESAEFSGSVMVIADSESEAIAKFEKEWSEYGDVAPSCWVSARWN